MLRAVVSQANMSMYGKRLQKELKALRKAPPPYLHALPGNSPFFFCVCVCVPNLSQLCLCTDDLAPTEPANLLKWWFVLTGPADSPYAGGLYVGIIRFPPQYPMKVRVCVWARLFVCVLVCAACRAVCPSVCGECANCRSCAPKRLCSAARHLDANAFRSI